MGTNATDPLPVPVPIAKPSRDTSHRTKLVARHNERQLELAWTEVPILPAQSETSASTDKPLDAREVQSVLTADLLPRRAYPHTYDPEGPTGAALVLLNSAKEEAAHALSAFNEGDVASVGTRLIFVAALMAKAYAHSAFNPALGAVITFVRRASLMADPTELGLSNLMGLAKATRTIADNPLMSLQGSADLIIELEEQDWTGADPTMARFVEALFNDNREETPDSSMDVEHEKGAIV